MENNNRAYDLFFIFLTVAVFIYLLIRASQFSFSEDEAFSLLDVRYMRLGYFFGNTPNSHLFNSGFLWLETKYFGFQEIFLRMHSVLSFLAYAWVVYKFSLHLKLTSLRFVFLFLIIFHPFMLTYFSMARGYAMSIAFMMLALYFLYEGILPETQKGKMKIYVASFWAGLSVISCYVMFTFYLGVLIFYAIFSLWVKNEKEPLKGILLTFWKEKIFWFIHFAFSLGIMYLVMKLKPSSLHEFWPYNSFWGDTIYSLVETTFQSSNRYVMGMYWVFVLLILLSFIFSLVDFNMKRTFTPHSLFVLLFVLIALLLSLQYYVFHITYISYRGAIFLYPLIILMIFWSWKDRKFSFLGLYASRGLLYLFTVGMVVNFVCSFSFSNGIGIVTKTGFVQALQDIKTLRKGEEKISLGVSRAFPATIYYYQMRYGFDWLMNIGLGYEPVKNEYYVLYGKEKIRTGEYDYFILEEPDIPVVSAVEKITILKKYPESGIVLAKSHD